LRTYVGVDWSATEIVCAFACGDDEPRGIRGAEPTLASISDLVDRVRAASGANEVFAMIEAGAPHWVHLLHQAGATVHVVDPKQARRFAESQGSSGAKDDRRDARSLADMCRSPRHRGDPWKPDEPEVLQLDVLASMHEELTKDSVRVKQRIRDLLRRHMPRVDKALPRELEARWVSTFLRKVATPWHARRLTREAFDRLVSGAHTVTANRVWAALQETQAPWLSARVASAVMTEMRMHVDQFALLRKQLDDVDQELDELTSDMATRQQAESMGGIAMMLSAALIQFAFRDGVPADRDEASVRMGASPVFEGSAKDRKGRSKGRAHMRRAADSRARRATYLIGRQASLHLGWGRAMYADARARGQDAPTAYRRIARCVLRIQTAMMRDAEPYDETRYVARLKANNVRWAMDL
jgi:transposase